MDVESGNDSDVPINFRWYSCVPGAQLTSFASRLAVLEKAAAGLGALGFIWASGVLLGGFASSLAKADFWFINVILLIEGIRIFSRRQIVRWQHDARWSLTGAVQRCIRPIKSGVRFAVETLKLAKVSRCIREIVDTADNTDERRDGNSISRKLIWTAYTKFSLALYCFQLASSTTCVILSSMKLIKHICGDVGNANARNQQLALNIFYSLALAEALLFISEKAYSEWMVMHRKLLEEVNRECQLGSSSIIYVRRFFYDAYSTCVNGSIFYALQKDMVSFAMDLLASSVLADQLSGAVILQKFATNDKFSYATLQKVGITTSVMARLVEMLNWKEVEQEEIRQSAAEILVKLAGRKHKPLQVAGSQGVMESISSLLFDNSGSAAASGEISVRMSHFRYEHHDLLTFVTLGLRLLKKLCREHGSCEKIGNTRGLLPKIIYFTYADERLLKDEIDIPTRILILKRSLQVVKMLASTTGTTGKQLRKEISEVVVTISNIRGMLQHGEKYPMLQLLGIEILTSLAVEEDGRELVGCTGNVIKELFNIYLKREGSAGPTHLNRVKVAAGEALSMLTSESTSNCHLILKLKVIQNLVRGLDDQVLKYIFIGEDELQEVMVGLAAQLFKFMTSQESSTVFERIGIREAELAGVLVWILRKHQYPSVRCLTMRRFVVELAICLMRVKDTNIATFKDLGMVEELQSVVETTSQIESFRHILWYCRA
ncbi:hypothetical protein RJ640_002634 [Escallonia rubra]|uniref:Uncharacterized protein n=1 Tax=Escallonia rubra TaxID=112253 RepID=A0AA88UMP3_9ASTE|nr:hypothetical protein RJ640_002634 [Escallonia rubra]